MLNTLTPYSLVMNIKIPRFRNTWKKVLKKNKKDFFDSKNLFSSKCLAKRTQIDTQDHIINYATAYLYISLRTHICRVSPKFELSTAVPVGRAIGRALSYMDKYLSKRIHTNFYSV